MGFLIKEAQEATHFRTYKTYTYSTSRQDVSNVIDRNVNNLETLLTGLSSETDTEEYKRPHNDIGTSNGNKTTKNNNTIKINIFREANQTLLLHCILVLIPPWNPTFCRRSQDSRSIKRRTRKKERIYQEIRPKSSPSPKIFIDHKQNNHKM